MEMNASAPGPVRWTQPAAGHESHHAAVSWSAVIGGAIVVASMSLILLALGTGLGLSALSPWSRTGATALGVGAIVWYVLLNAISGSLGGYLAGRFRARWTTIHSDEVYFRDTAHGFLAWGLAFVMTAAGLATAATSLSGSLVMSPSMASSTATSSNRNDPDAYFVDMLFRSNTSPIEAAIPYRAEAERILMKSMAAGTLSGDDHNRLVYLVSGGSGLTAGESDKRVNDVFSAAVLAAETARKDVAHSLLWIFLALLVGAFSASAAATIGGRQRDNVAPA